MKPIKPTKRKVFNFLRSYFDVLNKLENDEDKFSFLMAIINKQFLNEEPKGLNFLVDLCYESQRHQIERSLKGWLRVNKTDVMGDPTYDPMSNPTYDPMSNPVQVEEEEEEEVEEEYVTEIYPTFDDFWDLYDKKQDRPKCVSKWNKLKQSEKESIMNYVPMYKTSQPDKQFRKNPSTFLNNQSWNNEIIVKEEVQTEIRKQRILSATNTIESFQEDAEEIKRLRLETAEANMKTI
tara:strand:- start:358 stop:1065 length:708 start_codon:yes stop_codon:yes gene_type:complete